MGCLESAINAFCSGRRLLPRPLLLFGMLTPPRPSSPPPPPHAIGHDAPAGRCDWSTRIFASCCDWSLRRGQPPWLYACREQKRGYKDQWPFSVRIYKDDSTGKPKGDCIIKYEEPTSAHAALKWFDGVDFKGGKIGVAMAAKPSLNNRY